MDAVSKDSICQYINPKNEPVHKERDTRTHTQHTHTTHTHNTHTQTHSHRGHFLVSPRELGSGFLDTMCWQSSDCVWVSLTHTHTHTHTHTQTHTHTHTHTHTLCTQPMYACVCECLCVCLQHVCACACACIRPSVRACVRVCV